MRNWFSAMAGSLTGLSNGLFGGGGGMVLVPLLSRFSDLPQRKLYPTCVAVIFPVCLVSALVHLPESGLSLPEVLPYLAGGLFGGFLGGKLYQRVSTTLLRWLFAAFLLYASVRYLQ